MSLELVRETIKRVSPENAKILNSHINKENPLHNMNTLLALCLLMLNELGSEEE
jgi:hypothetical protein